MIVPVRLREKFKGFTIKHCQPAPTYFLIYEFYQWREKFFASNSSEYDYLATHYETKITSVKQPRIQQRRALVAVIQTEIFHCRQPPGDAIGEVFNYPVFTIEIGIVRASQDDQNREIEEATDLRRRQKRLRLTFRQLFRVASLLSVIEHHTLNDEPCEANLRSPPFRHGELVSYCALGQRGLIAERASRYSRGRIFEE